MRQRLAACVATTLRDACLPHCNSPICVLAISMLLLLTCTRVQPVSLRAEEISRGKPSLHLPPHHWALLLLEMSQFLNNPNWESVCNQTYNNVLTSRSNSGPRAFLYLIITCFVFLSFVSAGFVLAFRRCSQAERDAQWSLFLMFVCSCTAASVFGVASWSIALAESESLYNGLHGYATPNATQDSWCPYYMSYTQLYAANRIVFGFEQVFILIAELLVVDRLLRVTHLSHTLEKFRRLVWNALLLLCGVNVITRIVRGAGIVAYSKQSECTNYSLSQYPNIIAFFDYEKVSSRSWQFVGLVADGLMFSMVGSALIVGVRLAYRDTLGGVSVTSTTLHSNRSQLSVESASILSTMRKRILFWIFFMILGTFIRALFSFIATAGIRFTDLLAHDTQCPVCDQSCLGATFVFVTWYRLNP